MRFSRPIVAACIALLFVATAATAADQPAPEQPAAEQIDNPQFKNWSKFAVGSTATLDSQMTAGEQKITLQTTHKLLEKADDHVIVEVQATADIMGQKRDIPPQKMTIKPKMDKKDVAEIGNEKVDAAGKSFDCKVYEMKDPSGKGGDAKAKIWANDGVPGGMVKMQATGAHGTITSTLKSFEAK